MRKFILSTILLHCVQCGEELNYRETASQELDSNAAVGETTDFYLTLPDRSLLEERIPTVKDELNFFLIELRPEGDQCNDSEAIIRQDSYVDELEFKFALNRSCSYAINIVFGSKANSLALQSISYEASIKALVDNSCVSCHVEYASYDGMSSDFENIIFQIENRLMPPPEEPRLSDRDIAMFSAWRAGGYLNEDPNAIPEESPLNNFAKVFYRNNYNEYVFDFELENNTFVIYDDSVWLQENGESQGWEAVEFAFPTPDRDLD